MEILTLLANYAQIIGLPLAIIAIAVSIWLYRKGRQKRAISCTFDSVASPIEIKAGEALKGDIEIRYRGKPVENLFAVRANLKNTGNLAVRKSDTLEPIKFTFAESAELIRQPVIVHKIPDELSIDWQFGMTGNPPHANSVGLIFELLNPRDEISIEFICTGQSKIPKVTARIEGVSQIDVIGPYEAFLRKNRFHLFSFLGILWAMLLVGAMLLMGIITIDALRAGNLGSVIVGLLGFVGMAFFLWVSVLLNTFDLIKLRSHKQGSKSV